MNIDQFVRTGAMTYGEVKALEHLIRREQEPSALSPLVVTGTVICLCLLSFAIGLWIGEMQGLIIAKCDTGG